MAACGSLQHIFDNPLPENPSSLIESLSSSWKQIKPLKPLDHSLTEIFGELHFKENPSHPTSTSPSFFSSSSSSSSSLSSFPLDSINQGSKGGQLDEKWAPVSPFPSNGYQGSYHNRSESFSSMNSESLQLCTEGLGFESLDNIEDLKIDFQDTCLNHNSNNSNNDNNNNNDNLISHNYNSGYTMREKFYVRGHSNHHYSKGRTNRGAFPPPISCIGRTGKPWVCFQSYRDEGRFVLKEIRIPTQEFLHACREDGRLRLCFVQPPEQGDENTVEDDVGEEDGEGVMGVVGRIDEGEEEEGDEQDDSIMEEEEAEIRDEFERGNS